ncbi:Polynucleotide 3'-phosphatase ZDP-like protein, partial [Drosera capensis]
MLTTIAANIFPPPNPNLMSRLIAEYAKSSRSTCKVCSDPIVTKSLRLGVVARDARGFDLTKWHHLGCFSKVKLKGNGIEEAEEVAGFDSLKGDDKEALREVMYQWGKASDEAAKTKEDGESVKKKRGTKKGKVAETVEDGEDGKETSPKRAKLLSDVKVELALSAPDITDNYKDATLMLGWKAFQTIIFLEKDEGLQDSSKMAAFDFDGCLANTSVKRIGADAWSLMYPSIPEKLQRLYNDGYKLVIFTNESNIERWKNKRQVAVDSKLGRLDKFIKCVKVPIQVFIACGFDKGGQEDPFRKPKPGMWHIMEKHFNSGIKIDIDQSFYVGDAAGRANDHSDADIKFAEEITMSGCGDGHISRNHFFE